MSAPAIKVDGVSKAYRLGVGISTNPLLSERMGNALRRAFGRGDAPAQRELFWALEEVSLEIAPGEVVGLIGHNGAGKSTLLKLLSRITLPTRGRIELRGRVATLLEVGTGFHPELTGRENVWLNGTILGMRRPEIARHFDEIVEFSGIERFIDTPVKRYSSGMYVRLAFAVAAHLQPEILLVDEVLAVGDAEFQSRCIGKMQDVSRQEGRTIVFVSHNLAAVRRLCSRTFLVDSGRIAMAGPTASVLAEYLSGIQSAQAGGGMVAIPDGARREGTGGARVRSVGLLSLDGDAAEQVRFGEPFQVALTVEAERSLSSVVIQVGVSTTGGERFATAHSTDRGRAPFSLDKGVHEIRARLDLTLLPGEYVLDVGVLDSAGATLDWLEGVLRFTALNVAEAGDDHYPWETVRGLVRPDSDWTLVRSPAIVSR